LVIAPLAIAFSRSAAGYVRQVIYSRSLMISSIPASIPIVRARSGRRIFLDKTDYRTCHLQVPDIEERIPGVAFGTKLYSFFKVVDDREKALDVMAKLFDSGDDAVITQNPKGFAVWVLESTATVVPKKVKTA
jgi:hypothetical protein